MAGQKWLMDLTTMSNVYYCSIPKWLRVTERRFINDQYFKSLVVQAACFDNQLNLKVLEQQAR